MKPVFLIFFSVVAAVYTGTITAQHPTTTDIFKHYTAYAYIVTSFEIEDVNQKEQYLDKAQQFLDKAFEIAPEESELFALQAFLYPGKIMVDPMSRGQEYMGKI